MRIQVTDTIVLDDDDVSVSFSRSGGSGGQNVNKVSSKVLLRVHLARANIDEAIKMRLRVQNPGKMTTEGDLLITSELTRDQHQNLDDAQAKLIALILAAEHPPRPRKKTKPTKGSQRRRLDDKRKHSEKKRGRGVRE